MADNITQIPYDSLFDFEECLWFLDRNFDDCMHKTNGDAVRKALLVVGEPTLLEITSKEKEIQIELLHGKQNPENGEYIRQYVKNWFDLERDLSPFYQLLNQHPKLAYMANDFKGLRLIGIPDLFEALSWCIIGQQINLAFAYKLKRRLVEKYGIHLKHENSVYHIFPSYQSLALVKPDELRDLQFSRQKSEYLIGLAQAFTKNEISKEKLLQIPSLESRQKALTGIRGIGIWTANYALMKSLNEPSAIPYGDAGLLNALLRHEIIKDKKDQESLDKLFDNFKGWESYLVFYLWRSLAPKTGKS